MQNVVYGLTELAGSGSVDSIWRVSGKDSIFWRRNSITFAIKDSAGGSGIDSGAFRNIVALGDSGLIFQRANGLNDTAVFRNGGAGGGSGSSGTTISDSTFQWATNNGKTTTNNIFVGSHNTVSSDTAEVALYKTFATGSANYGSGQNSWGISFDPSLRVRQKGYIRYIKLNVVSLPARLTSFYITIWRRSSGIAFNIVDSINILPYLQVGVNTIQLPKKLYAQDGDCIGWGYSSSSSGSNFLNLQSLSGGGAIGYYYNTAASHPADGTEFVGLSSLTQYLPIVAYMDAPAMVFIGDSKTSGYNSSISSYTQETTTLVRGQSFPDLVADSLALTFQNMGIGNTTITTTVQRFQKDVVEAKPKYVVIEIGVNSIALGISTDSIMNDFRRMLGLCTTNSIKPIIVKILPWTNGSNAQNRRRDSINNLLVTEATNYNAILIDCSAEVGQFRSGGDVGNLWDIVPAYTSDGVHFTSLGYQVIASKIYQTLRTQLDNRFPTNPTDGGAILQVNSKDKGFAFPIWNGYQSRINDSLHYRFREGIVAYNDSTQTLKLNKRNGFKDIVTQDYPVSGTNATRLTLTGMPAGTRYFQTDYLVGDWIYTGTAWRYQIHDFVINREFERAEFNSFQAPTEVAFTSGGTSGSWFTLVSGMEMPVTIGTGTNSNGGTILSNHAGFNVLPFTNKIFSTVINLSSLGALSNSTDRYVVRVGMGLPPSSISEPSSFVGIRYCDTINGGAFQAYARNSGVETTANTSITAVLGTTYEIVITHYGSSVEYWINGVKAATISTNVPIGGRGGYHSIFKTSGTTSRSLILSGIKILKF